MRLIGLAVVLIGLLVISASCAAPVRASKMVAEAIPAAPATLRERITITTVTTPDFNPLAHPPVQAVELRQAVEESLQKAGYLNADPTKAPLLLAIALISLENSGIATVTSRIRYALTNRANSTSLFNDVVEAECSKYAYWAAERLQHSTECSMRENIEAFLNQLLLLPME